MSTYLLRDFFLKVLDENPKIVLPALILKKNINPQFHQIFKTIRKIFCIFLPIQKFELRTSL